MVEKLEGAIMGVKIDDKLCGALLNVDNIVLLVERSGA